jgi:hypothetical protein
MIVYQKHSLWAIKNLVKKMDIYAKINYFCYNKIMTNSFWEPEIIEYIPVTLPHFSPLDAGRPERWERELTALIQTMGTQPVELRGKTALFFSYAVYVAARKVSTEIIYRESSQDPGQQLYSMLDSARYLLPAGVRSRQDFFRITGLTNIPDSFISDGSGQSIDLELIWNTIGKQDEHNACGIFLNTIFLIPINCPVITITGIIPPLPALFALDWFLQHNKRVWYDGILLK